jgi:hypothetical protein
MTVLTMTYKFTMLGGQYSILADHENLRLWVMEPEWHYNRRHVSSIPRDEYVLEEHNGAKYKNTFAVIGDGVGHWESEGKPRYACVFHQAVFPSDLTGCLAPAKSIGPVGQAIGSREATEELLAYLDLREGPIKILCQ